MDDTKKAKILTLWMIGKGLSSRKLDWPGMVIPEKMPNRQDSGQRWKKTNENIKVMTII